jgi:hypothetical protein
LLISAGALWHYRERVREEVVNRFFYEPEGGPTTAAAPSPQPVQATRPSGNGSQVRPTSRLTTSQPPSAPSSEYVAPEDRFRPTTSSAQQSAAAVDQGLQPLPTPEATAPVPVVPTAAPVPRTGRDQATADMAAPSREAPDALPAEGVGSNAKVARDRRVSRPQVQEVRSSEGATRAGRAKHGYVWSPAAAALVPATEASASSSPSSSATSSPSSPPSSSPAAAPLPSPASTSNKRGTGLSPDDTLAPGATNAPTPAPAAATTSPKEAPPAAAERRPEEPAPKAIVSPSLGSPAVIAPPPPAPEPDERPVTPTEPPPFK